MRRDEAKSGRRPESGVAGLLQGGRREGLEDAQRLAARLPRADGVSTLCRREQTV